MHVRITVRHRHPRLPPSFLGGAGAGAGVRGVGGGTRCTKATGVRGGISPNPPGPCRLPSSPAVTGQTKKLGSVLGLSFQLQSLRVDSDLGVDVRQGSSPGLGLALGKDVGVPSAVGRLRSLVGSRCSPHSEPAGGLPGKPAWGRSLPSWPLRGMGLMLAMATGKGFAAGGGEVGGAGLPFPNVGTVTWPPAWCGGVAPAAAALKYSVESPCPSPPRSCPPAPLSCTPETAPAPPSGPPSRCRAQGLGTGALS